MSGRILLLLFVLTISQNLMSQRNCGSMHHYHELMEQNPDFKENRKAIEKATQAFINNPEKAVNGIITIPVVVHVVYNTAAENISDAQILSQITVLNDDFRRTNSDADNTWAQAADTEIEFCMATVDPNGNATNGITRTATSVTSFSTNDNVKFNSSGGKDAWPRDDYLNIWVCDISGGILGYAQFPGGPAATDGVVNDYQYFGTVGTATAPFDLGRTCTHEVGHWLDLFHIWGDGPCGQDDGVADTPTSDNPNYGCALGHVSCGSTDMVQNYMDYSDDACMNLYTQGQTTRMRALFDTNGFRESLLNSNGCGQGNPPTCTDGVQNGQETGVDCGGPDCPPCSSGCNDTEVTLTIVLDNYPGETTWEITNSGGGVVASGGPYSTQGGVVNETYCLADGCYDFTIFDSYGDGICCAYGIGSYDLVDDNNNTLASGGQFASQETTNFCLGGGSGPTCSDGIQNGDETGVDCGGSVCPPCNTGCSYQPIDFENFESGWGIWNDGGSDCRRSANDAAYAFSGNYCVRIRDNTSTSVMTTDNLNLNGFSEVTIDFTYIAASMETGEDFWLQASLDGGASYQTLITWARGTDFQNNSREFETVIITGTFTSSTRFRFRCDASVNNDRIFIDDVDISGCTSSGTRDNNEVEELVSLNDNAYVPKIEDVLLYPNPASDILNVTINSKADETLQLVIIDANGQLIQKQMISSLTGINNTPVDISLLESGIYMLQVISEKEQIVKKFSVLK